LFSFPIRRALGAGAVLVALCLVAVGPVTAHEHRHVGEYAVIVGFIDEPVYTGQKSGLEFSVEDHDGQPVAGLVDTLQAEVIYGQQRQDLPLSARYGAEGWYQSVFFPTAAGQYTFRIHGTINGQAVDESFTSGPDTFSEVREQTAGQFPTVLPPTSQIAADAQQGAQAAQTAMIALAAGIAGAVLALVAIGLALAARRRPA
jgi:hypothetical protein